MQEENVQKYAWGTKNIDPVTQLDVLIPQINRKMTIAAMYKAYVNESDIEGKKLSEYAFTMLAKKATVVEVGTLYAIDSQAVRYGSDNIN